MISPETPQAKASRNGYGSSTTFGCATIQPRVNKCHQTFTVSTGKSTAIHCRAGIGRSSLMAAAVLISGGAEAAIALSVIEKARGLPIPDTHVQRAWVMALGGK